MHAQLELIQFFGILAVQRVTGRHANISDATAQPSLGIVLKQDDVARLPQEHHENQKNGKVEETKRTRPCAVKLFDSRSSFAIFSGFKFLKFLILFKFLYK